MKVEAIADLISRVQEDEDLRQEIIKGDFPVKLSPDERMAVRETVLRMEKGEVIPAHLEQVPAAVWLAARLS